VIVTGTKRGENTYEYSFQKFVEMFHILMETPIYGPGSGRDTNDTERHLKGWAVKPSKTAQKRDDATFTGQISLRNAEANVLKKIRKSNSVQDSLKVEPTRMEEEENGPFLGRGLYYFILAEDDEYYFKGNTHFDVDDVVLEWLLDNFDGQGGVTDDGDDATARVSMFTETKLRDGTILRCHPNFGGKGPRYDCVKLPGQDQGGTPARIVALYSDPGKNLLGPTHVLVAEADSRRRKTDNDSQLFKEWVWKHGKSGSVYKLRLSSHPLSAVLERIYCIDEQPTRALQKTNKEGFGMLECRKMRTEWPEEFLRSEHQLTRIMDY
jgi:hypothetical protein